MKILDLPLKKEWYEMIERKEKPEEYRGISKFWMSRLMTNYNRIDCSDNDCVDCNLRANGTCKFKQFDTIRPRYGYTNRTMLFKLNQITIGIGKPELGAPVNKNVFILKLGEKL